METFPRRSLTVKLQFTRILTTDQINLIVRHLPCDMDGLRSMVPELTDEAELNKVLAITRAHTRNQDQFLECASVLRAYARGGEYGVHLLNKLHSVVIKHYHMEGEKWEVLTAAGVSMDFETGELVVRSN